MAETPEPDWYLQEWASELSKIQADLVTELGMHKNTAWLIWHGQQPYKRATVNKIANWLGIKPYELLMPPGEALALRRLRASAVLIAAESGATFEHAPAPSPPPKTVGDRR